MSYKLKFLPTALKEWKKLDNTIQAKLKKKLEERLDAPHVISCKLSGQNSEFRRIPGEFRNSGQFRGQHT
jgi:mRNA interferase RelE/StbE